MGSRTIGSLLVKLGFDPKEADKGLQKFEKNLKDSGRRMESIGRTMSIGFTAPFVLGMRQAIKAYDEEATAVRKLEIALGRTSSALLNQAAALQKTTTFADDAVINIQAYAAALGHSEEETQKMTNAAVNLAAGLGISLDSAMEMLHKSTLGAAKGLGNLLPGVKDLTKEQLKAGAAVDMVNQRFAGYADQLAKTGAGPLKQFQNRFGDLMEQFGEQALPLLNKIIEKFTKLTDWFSKLSPETKKLVIEVGAFVALAGPVLLMAGNVIKLAASFKMLGESMKFLGGPYVAALVATVSSLSWFGENIGYGNRFGAGEGKLMKLKHGKVNSSMFGQNPDLIPGMSGAQNSGFLAPPANTGQTPSGQIAAATTAANNYSGALQRALQWQTALLSPNRGNPAAGIGSIQPNTSPAIAGSMGGGALTPLAGVGGHGQAIADMMAIAPDMTAILEGQQATVDALTSSYTMLGEVISSTVSNMISAFADGAGGFAAFGKAALAMAGQVVKAMLAVLLAKATAEAAKGGPIGAVIGLSIAIGVVGALEGAIGKIKTPKLAQGGVVTGPTMALMGDNASGKEMALPWEKTREFAGMISQYMGGGGSSVHGIIRGNDIHLVTSREQGFAARRGSGNLIQF